MVKSIISIIKPIAKPIIKPLLGSITKVYCLVVPLSWRNEAIWQCNKFSRSHFIAKWKKEGKPIPPPWQVKQMIIDEYKNKYNCAVLVETGTYKGDTIDAQRKNFKRLYSIELGMDLWKGASKKFKCYKHITILQGNSEKKLHDVISQLDDKALFWLDGHYSAGITAKGDKDCPILGEVDAIFEGKRLNHVLLVDDARLFVGKYDYPTIDELTSYIRSKEPKYTVKVEDDIIRYTCD